MSTPTLVASVVIAQGSAPTLATTASRDTTGATQLRLVVITESSALLASNITDSKGNTWAIESGPTTFNVAFGGAAYVFAPVGAVLVGTGHTFSVSVALAKTMWMVAVGPSAGGVVTIASTGLTTDTSSPYTSASITPAASTGLLVAVGASDGGTNTNTIQTWSGGFTPISGMAAPDHAATWGGDAAYQITSSVAAYASSYTDDSSGVTNSFSVVFSFSEAAMGMRGSGLNVSFVGDATSPVVTGTPFTTITGDMLIAAVGRGYAPAFDTESVTDNKSNGAYTGLLTYKTYTNWPGSGTRVFAKPSALGGASHSVQTTKAAASPTDEITIIGAGFYGVDTVSQTLWNEDMGSLPNTSPAITVTKNAILVSVWSGDDVNGNTGFAAFAEQGWGLLQFTTSIASNHVQMAMAWKVVGPGTYTCGWNPNVTQNGQVWISSLTGNDVPLAPTIGAQPNNQVIRVDEQAIFTVTSGDADSQQWQTQQGGAWSDIPGATSLSYITPVAQTTDSAGFRCVLTNTIGSTVSSAASLTVVPKSPLWSGQLSRRLSNTQWYRPVQGNVLQTVSKAGFFKSITSTVLKVLVGASFLGKPAKVWTGAAWVAKTVKRWAGSSWL